MKKKLDRFKFCLYAIFVAFIFLVLCSLGKYCNDEYWIKVITVVCDILRLVIILSGLVAIDPLIDVLYFLYNKNKEDY